MTKFKLITRTSYPWTVRFDLGGQSYEQPLLFCYMDQSRIDELLLEVKRQEALLLAGEVDGFNMTSRAVADQILAGWPDGSLTGDDDEVLPVTAENRNRLLEVQGLAAAIVRAWVESLDSTSSGNSKRSRGIG